MSFFSTLEEIFGNPFVGFGMAALGLYSSYYFYIKQAHAQGNMEAIVARLQEENSKLRELLNSDEDEALSDPSRERVIINLRALLQREDRKISPWKTVLPAFCISSPIWIACFAFAIWIGYYGTAVLIFFAGGVANLFVGSLLADLIDTNALRKKTDRMRDGFMQAKLNLREIDQLSKWVSAHRWTYLNEDWVLEVFQIWGTQTAKEWGAKPKTNVEPKTRLVEERRKNSDVVEPKAIAETTPMPTHVGS